MTILAASKAQPFHVTSVIASATIYETKCCLLVSGTAEQEQSMCQCLLRGRAGVCCQWERGAQLPVHRSEWGSDGVRKTFPIHVPGFFSPSRAVSPTRGQYVAAMGRPTGTIVSCTGMHVWADWKSKWPTMDTARVHFRYLQFMSSEKFSLKLDKTWLGRKGCKMGNKWVGLGEIILSCDSPEHKNGNNIVKWSRQSQLES